MTKRSSRSTRRNGPKRIAAQPVDDALSPLGVLPEEHFQQLEGFVPVLEAGVFVLFALRSEPARGSATKGSQEFVVERVHALQIAPVGAPMHARPFRGQWAVRAGFAEQAPPELRDSPQNPRELIFTLALIGEPGAATAAPRPVPPSSRNHVKRCGPPAARGAQVPAAPRVYPPGDRRTGEPRAVPQGRPEVLRLHRRTRATYQAGQLRHLMS